MVKESVAEEEEEEEEDEDEEEEEEEEYEEEGIGRRNLPDFDAEELYAEEQKLK
jgi:hypothetical protein